jgi:hypothetical protein
MGSAMAQAGAGIVSREMRSSLEEKARRTSIESLEALASGVEGMRVATAVESNDRRAQPRLTAGVAIAPTATSTTQMDPNAWAFDDSDEALSADELWAAEQLQLSGRFAAPFQGEHIYPRIGLGSSFFIGQGVDGGLNQFVGQFDLSLYWIDLHVPYSNLIDGERLPTRIRVDMKIPIPVPIDSASRFALMGGATFSDEYPQLIDSVRFQVAWGYGGEVLSFQVRGGYGYRDTFDQSQMKQGFLYGSTLGLNLGPVQPLLEIDGVRFDDLTGQVDFIPGIRFYPLDTPSLRLGIAALFTFTHEPGDSTLKRRRFGTMFQMSYDFL